MSLRGNYVIVKLLIASTLLLSPTSSNGLTVAGLKKRDLETQMAKGTIAPFEGVLVPYPQYYYYNEMVERSFEYEHDDREEPNILWWALGFFTAGVVTGILIESER